MAASEASHLADLRDVQHSALAHKAKEDSSVTAGSQPSSHAHSSAGSGTDGLSGTKRHRREALREAHVGSVPEHKRPRAMMQVEERSDVADSRWESNACGRTPSRTLTDSELELAKLLASAAYPPRG